MKKLLLSAIVCVLAMFGTLKAQDKEVIIDGAVGSHTESMNRFAPIFVAVQYSVSQQYYTAEEMGAEAGPIKSVSFKTDMNWQEDDPRRLEVYMANTEESSFNDKKMKQLTSEDLVFSGKVTFTASSWITINFDKAFNYTGGNVLLCVSDLSGEMCYFDSYFTSFIIPEEEGVRCMWSSDEAMFFDPTASVITAKETINAVPFVKFTFGEVEEQPEEPEQPEENADEVVIDGTVGSYSKSMNRFAPVFVVVQYSISQQYYTAEEIGKEAGNIKSLAFKTDTWYEENPRRLEVYMANAEESSFDDKNMKQLTSEDLVFSGNVKFTPNTWVTIDFEKYFNYTGGNVLVCVSDLTGQALCPYDSYFTSFVLAEDDATRCMWSSDEDMFFDPTASVVTAKETVNAVPFVKFTFTDEEQPENPEQPGEGVEEHEASFNICPNPVNDRLYIETLTQTQTLTVEIYDVYGRQQLMVNGQQSTVIDVTSLNSGIYFVKVVTENGEMVKRFIKK